MTLMTARALRKDGSFDYMYFAEFELPLFLLYSRGAGSAIKEAARKIQRKSAEWNTNFFTYRLKREQRDYRDAGSNGALMRIAPHAVANQKVLDDGLLGVWQNTVMTHGHPRAIVGAIWQYYAIGHALSGFTSDSICEFLVEKLEATIMPETAGLQSWLAIWNQLSGRDFENEFSTTRREAIRFLVLLERHLRKDGDQDFLKQIGAFNSDTRGSGTVTAAAASYFYAKYYHEPVRGLKRCINMLGTDTDTIAAAVGALFGAKNDQIPEKWFSVQDAAYLASIEDTGVTDRFPGRQLDLSSPAALWDGQATVVAHPTFGRGHILDSWDDINLRKKHIRCVRVQWDFGQSMVFSATI